MSIRVMSDVWTMDLPPADKLVLLALADAANDEGLCWPSIATIAKKSGLSERSVQRAIRRFEDQKLLERDEVRGKGCKYHLSPRHSVTPDTASPVTNETKTPDTVSPKPLKNHQSKNTQTAHVRPDDWMPAPFGLKTKSRAIVDGWPPGEMETQLEHFAAHHRSKGSKFKDWQDAWSTWVLNSRRFGGQGNGNNRQSGAKRHQRRDGFIDACFEAAANQAADPFAGNC